MVKGLTKDLRGVERHHDVTSFLQQVEATILCSMPLPEDIFSTN